mgnify:CR=1 FL=1
MSKARTALTVALAVALCVFTWLFKFNNPQGSFAGLTDDHFFYLIRGWQILFGDLPVRDFVDHGAPLFYYVGAAVQAVLGRGTLSEIYFCVTVLAVCAGLVFWLSATASGSILVGLAAGLLHVLLDARLYNYPKILVYAVAIPLLWRFCDAPGAAIRSWLAVVTVIGFLFRHDHGAFVAVAVATALLAMERLSWTERLKHAVLYGVTVLALLAPYLWFIQSHGGVRSYFEQAMAWAERDRDRAPVVFPGPFEYPDGTTDTAGAGLLGRGVAAVGDNIVAWTYYAELALPLVALYLLAQSPTAFRPRWPQARAKMLTVAVLALVLDAGFLRSPLGARLADPSVPLAILLAWAIVALVRLFVVRADLGPSARSFPWLPRVVALALVAPLVFVFGVGMSRNVYRRLDQSGLTDRFGKGFERVGTVSAQLAADWRLETWQDRPSRPELLDLSFYVSACTRPTDRILVQAYLPQVTAMARRAFAGGHADLRPGFFTSESAQRLTVARLERQSVPIVLLDTGESLEGFRESFPIVTAYIDRHYRAAGERTFDGRFGITLFVRRDRRPQGTYKPFGWPCYGSGVVGAS